MASWWRIMAGQLSIAGTSTGSHKKRIARALSAAGTQGGWSRRIAGDVGIVQTKGGWDRRMTPADTATTSGSWPRKLATDEVLVP